jgi:hypothetical protein
MQRLYNTVLVSDRFVPSICNLRSLSQKVDVPQNGTSGDCKESADGRGGIAVSLRLYSLSPTVRLRRDHCDHTCRVVLLYEASEGGRHRVFGIYPSTPGCPVSQPPFSSACNLTVIATRQDMTYCADRSSLDPRKWGFLECAAIVIKAKLNFMMHKIFLFFSGEN